MWLTFADEHDLIVDNESVELFVHTVNIQIVSKSLKHCIAH